MSSSDHALQTFLWSEGIDPDVQVSDELRQRITTDWESFREQAEALGFDAPEHRATMVDPTEGDEWDYAAHDFILTRNHHGAGFWDGDWHEPWGDKLTALAHSFGQLECLLDENNVLHLY